MNLFSALAIYLLFWVLSAFLVLPFGIRSMEELGQDKIPGQQDGVPAIFVLAALSCAPQFYLQFCLDYIWPITCMAG